MCVNLPITYCRLIQDLEFNIHQIFGKAMGFIQNFLVIFLMSILLTSALIYAISSNPNSIVQAIKKCSPYLIDGTDGIDTLVGQEIYGHGGDDIIKGTICNDNLDGGPGADKIRGLEGNDTLYGNIDNDQIEGNEGNDLINGKDGDDVIDGGAGDDDIKGGWGIDILTGGPGADKFDCGGDKDTVTDYNKVEGDTIPFADCEEIAPSTTRVLEKVMKPVTELWVNQKYNPFSNSIYNVIMGCESSNDLCLKSPGKIKTVRVLIGSDCRAHPNKCNLGYARTFTEEVGWWQAEGTDWSIKVIYSQSNMGKIPIFVKVKPSSGFYFGGKYELVYDKTIICDKTGELCHNTILKQVR
jgi:hypothetical protein